MTLLLMPTRWIILLILGIGVFAVLWKNLTVPSTVGIRGGQLNPCPSSPNCVQSCLAGDSKHFIQPLPYFEEEALTHMEDYMKTHYLAVTVEKTETYLHLVVITPLCRFRDDVEFLVKREEGIICVRSASRLGYGDGGINRMRIEKLREFLNVSNR